MTSSSRLRRCALALLVCGALPAWAGLGSADTAIAGERLRLRAQHAVLRGPLYTVHELRLADGSRLQQYAASNGLVFAVRWDTLFKPQLATLLGTAFPSYAAAAHTAAQRGGIQRQFRHQGADLVVQSSGHLHVFSGFAYRPSLLPRGLAVDALGLGS